MRKVSPVERAAIKAVVLQWKITSMAVAKAITMFDYITGGIWQRAGGKALKKIEPHAGDAEELLRQIRSRHFEWVNDPADGLLNVVFPLWFTLSRCKGDCDDGAKLVHTLRGGKVWVLGTKIQSTDSAGHVVCVDNEGYLWSHNKGTDMEILGKIGTKDKDMIDNGSKALSRWKYLVELDIDTFKVGAMYKA